MAFPLDSLIALAVESIAECRMIILIAIAALRPLTRLPSGCRLVKQRARGIEIRPSVNPNTEAVDQLTTEPTGHAADRHGNED